LRQASRCYGRRVAVHDEAAVGARRL